MVFSVTSVTHPEPLVLDHHTHRVPFPRYPSVHNAYPEPILFLIYPSDIYRLVWFGAQVRDQWPKLNLAEAPRYMSRSPVFTLHEPPLPPASIAHLLKTNAAPQGMETNLVGSYIEELHSHLASLGDAMELLKRRRAEVRRTLKSCKATLSPIRRLPPEILGLIFSEGVHATYFFGDISDVQPPVTRHAPWLFTRICRHWSAVALATPSLWSLIFIDLDRIGVNGAIPLTKLYIERSRNVPLTLKIFHERGVEPHPVLDVLLSSSAQWRVADLYMTPPVLQQITRIQNGFPILKTLRISVDFAMVDNFRSVSSLDQAFWDVFSATPELRHVQAHSWATSGFIRPPFTLPWHQLTVLSTTTTSNIEALAVLEKLSNINKCTIAFSENLVLIRDHGTVHLPYLQGLTLQIESDDEGVVIYEKHTTMLDFLETPSLSSLVLFSTADEEAVLGLITRSNCASSLTSLLLHSNTINPDMALRLTTKLPRLTFLELGDFDGKLSPWSPLPLPDFVHDFSDQWLKMQKANGERQTLSMRVTDRALEAKDAQRITSRYTRLDRDGLFIIVSSATVYPSIVMEHFEY